MARRLGDFEQRFGVRTRGDLAPEATLQTQRVFHEPVDRIVRHRPLVRKARFDAAAVGADDDDEIVRACDGLMVARGDLGIECPFEELPVIQRRAVRACLAQGRPVIVATHMLESMISQPVPTRAEITDVANAVYELADCVMLSGETTIGKYPLECVQMLDKISRRIEAEEADDGAREPTVFTGERMKVLHSAVVLANQIPRSQLLTFTRHGFMAQGLAMLRPAHSSILAFTPSPEVFRQLRLLRAVEPFLMPLASEPDITIENAITTLRRAGRIAAGDKLIVATDIVAQDHLVDSVQLRTVR